MTDEAKTRAQRIAEARADLARRYADNPDQVRQYHLRTARLDAARKREQERFATRVLGQAPEPPSLKKPAGMSRAEWKVERKRLQAEAMAAMSPAAKWAGKQGTPETLEHANTTHQGALAQLHANGVIDNEQLEWTAEISNVHRSIESDVRVSVASLEARVDQSRNNGAMAGESIRRIRLHLAYGYWRDMLPHPKQLVLDMIVGDAVGYTVAAKRYHVHNRKAKRLLIDAINRWPECVDRSYRRYSDDDIQQARDAA